MALETKDLYYGSADKKTEQIALMKKFGWEYTEDRRYGRSGYHAVYARDKDMPNYRLVAALEEKYFRLDGQKKYYQPADPWICILLFVLFIIPLVFYLWFKSDQKQKYADFNAGLERQKNEILKEVSTLV